MQADKHLGEILGAFLSATAYDIKQNVDSILRQAKQLERNRTTER